MTEFEFDQQTKTKSLKNSKLLRDCFDFYLYARSIELATSLCLKGELTPDPRDFETRDGRLEIRCSMSEPHFKLRLISYAQLQFRIYEDKAPLRKE